MPKQDIIVIGASAGGVEALKEIVRGLPVNIPAAIFITLHVARQGTSVLPQILTRNGALPAVFPEHHQLIEHGKIYVAPNDHHMLVANGHIHVTSGPRENGFRPGIDPLFRTAAKVYGPRVVSVVLTGLLDNGSAGTVDVKARGGTVIVQDPEEAMFSSMPDSVLRVIDVDYVLPVAHIAEILVKLARGDIPSPKKSKTNEVNPMTNEPDSAEDGESDDIYSDPEGTITDLICPDCGGVLVEFKSGKDNQLVSFECRVGHRYSLQSMELHQSEATEEALWAAVRALEESASVSQRMIEYTSEWDDQTTRQMYEEKATRAQAHADVIRRILLSDAT